MKVMHSAFLGLGLLLAVSATQAQQPRVKANIPFDFVVGDRVMATTTGILHCSCSFPAKPLLKIARFEVETTLTPGKSRYRTYRIGDRAVVR